MLEVLFRASSELGSMADWFAFAVAVIVGAFVLYVGVALWAVLRAPDQQRELRYQIFRDLLDLFRRGNGTHQ